MKRSATPTVPLREKELGARGRPRSFDRETALDAALRVFWRYGYDASSLAELTAAMKITPPSLYTAFGSKKELFLEAVELYGKTYASASVKALEDEPTARGAIERLLYASAASICDPAHPYGCFAVVGAMNCTPDSADVEAALRARRKASEKALRARIARGIEEGELPEGTQAAALAKFYGAVVQGMSVQARDGASKKELESIVRNALLVWPDGSSLREKRRA